MSCFVVVLVAQRALILYSYLLRSYNLHIFFFFTDPATTEIYTLSLHDALPISPLSDATTGTPHAKASISIRPNCSRDRKSTRLNSSHMSISYAVFCLKKKNNKATIRLALTTWKFGFLGWSETELTI